MRDTAAVRAESREKRLNTDKALLAYAASFESLAAELVAAQMTNAGLEQMSLVQNSLETDAGNHCERDRTKQIEEILARLSPVEMAIMTTPACTSVGLGVKARHVAHVLSEYWDVPLDHLDWEAQAVRLLVEAVCGFSGAPMPSK